jgi:WD40 repeat protein
MENKPVMALAFNSDGNILAAGNSHGGLKLWFLGKPGSLPIEFIGHLSWISKIVFIPKSKSIASASFDGTIRIWDYESSQQQPVVIRDHDGWIYGLTVAPGGEYIVSSGTDKTIRFFDIVTSQIAQRVCKMVSRNMSKTEWNEYVGSDIEFEKTCPNLP